MQYWDGSACAGRPRRANREGTPPRDTLGLVSMIIIADGTALFFMELSASPGATKAVTPAPLSARAAGLGTVSVLGAIALFALIIVALSNLSL